MEHRYFFVGIFCLCLLACSFQVSALGVTPGRITLDFSPGLQKDLSLTVINSQKSDINLEASVQGELGSAVKLSQRTFSMKADEEERTFSFSLQLPETLLPGTRTADVVITQKQAGKYSSGQTEVGAQIAVASQIAVYVPYPGKYIEAMVVVDGNEKKKQFTVSVVHRGKKDIEKLSAILYLYDAQNHSIKELRTSPISLKAGEKGELKASWDVDVPFGHYLVKALIGFDGEQLYVQKDFDVGDFVLDLKQIYVKNFKLGEIAKFTMVVENKWNEPITKAYAQMRVFDKDTQTISDVKSAAYDVPPRIQTEMVYYWDTKNISEGLYNANIILYYASKQTQQDLKLDIGKDYINVIGLGYAVSSESSGGSSTITILGIIIGFLVLLNLFWFLVLRKRSLRRRSHS